MKNNTIIELADATMVLAFGSELPQFLINEMKKGDREVKWYDGTAMTSEEFMGSVRQTLLNERCRKVIEDAGYTIDGVFLAYEGKDLMAEDATQWWYLRNIGERLCVVGYEVYDDATKRYVMVFDFRDYTFEPTLRSSLDEQFCGKPLTNKSVGNDKTPYVIGFIDHITGDSYYVLREDYNKYYKKGIRLSENIQTIMAGHKVRGMSEYEEYKDATDVYGLMCLTDIWGNICMDEEPNERWIMARL